MLRLVMLVKFLKLRREQDWQGGVAVRILRGIYFWIVLKVWSHQADRPGKRLGVRERTFVGDPDTGEVFRSICGRGGVTRRLSGARNTRRRYRRHRDDRRQPPELGTHLHTTPPNASASCHSPSPTGTPLAVTETNSPPGVPSRNGLTTAAISSPTLREERVQPRFAKP